LGITLIWEYNSGGGDETQDFFCKLELTDGTTVDLDGSGELTQAMVATPYASTLYKMHVGNLCTRIGSKAAQQCRKLEEVVVDEGVTTVGNQAFNADVKLAVVDFPSTLTSIGTYCFHNMGNVNCNLTFRSLTPPSINFSANNLFTKYTESITIYVPAAALDTYKTAWSSLSSNIFAIPS
jgi:hypothetical protein